MKSYLYGPPSGRKIGDIGDYILYSKTLVKDQPTNKPYVIKESDTAFNFSYGPSMGGIIESTLFNVLTTGELIKGMTSDPMFKKRDLRVRGKSVEDALFVIERINGPFTASHSLAFLGAVEDAMELEIENQVLFTRMIELELERIRNHMHVAARICEAAAFGVPYNTLFYLREEINRVIGKYTGHRFFRGVNKPGKADINFTGVSDSLKNIGKEAEDTYHTLLNSKLFVDRLLNNGVVKDVECLGPVARGSGYVYDARTDSDTLPYDELNFKPILETMGLGDTMDRFMVRFEEIFQSLKIISELEKLLEKNPKTKENTPRMIREKCEGLGRVESPSGDLAYLIILDEGNIKEINMLTPSKVNLPVFLKSTRDNVFTDFHFNWESFGIWISEIAVNFL